MRLKPQDIILSDKQMGREIERFLDNTERYLWKEKIEKLDVALRNEKAIFYNSWLKERNPFLQPLKEYFKLRTSGKSIWRNASTKLRIFSSTIVPINRMFHSLNDSAKKRIIGELRSNNIKAFLFEIQVAAHFLVIGHDVDFVDLERCEEDGPIFEFLVSDNMGIEIEIECKRKGVDAGYRVTREGFYLLSDLIYEEIRDIPKSCVVNIKLRWTRFLWTGNCVKG